MWNNAPELPELASINHGIVCAVEAINAQQKPMSTHAVEEKGPFFAHGYYVGLARFNVGPYKELDEENIACLLYRIVVEYGEEPEFI